MKKWKKMTAGMEQRFKGSGHLFFHIAIIALSAWIVLSLPHSVEWIARFLLSFWSFVADEKIFLITIEIVLAALLVLFFKYLGKSWTNRRVAGLARKAGLLDLNPGGGYLHQRRSRNLKRKAGFAREVMGIFCTGFQTIVGSKGDFHEVIRNCREARIMVLNPYGEGMAAFMAEGLRRGITPLQYREQVSKTICFLRGLQGMHHGIRLKLYDDPPFLRLQFVGDTLWMRPYPVLPEIREYPEYVLENNRDSGGLFMTFYRYFLLRWTDPSIPEYDFITSE